MTVKTAPSKPFAPRLVHVRPPATPCNLRRYRADAGGIVWLDSIREAAKRNGWSHTEARKRLEGEARMLNCMLGLDARLKSDTVVYIAQAKLTGLVKIGFSDNLQRRLRAIASNAGPLRLLAQISGDAAYEARLHRRFAAHRRHGEWFDPAPTLLRFAERMTRVHAPSEDTA